MADVDEADRDNLAFLARMHRRRIAAAVGLAVTPAVVALAIVMLQPSPCEAFARDMCEAAGVDDCPIAFVLGQVGVSEDECAETNAALREVLRKIPPGLEADARVAAFRGLLEKHVDPERIDAVFEAARSRRDERE